MFFDTYILLFVSDCIRIIFYIKLTYAAKGQVYKWQTYDNDADVIEDHCYSFK